MLPQAIHQIKQSFAPMRKRADHDAAHPFTMISNATINARGLSSNALGALVWIMAQPDGAPLTVEALAAHTGNRTAARKAFRELTERGHLVRMKWRRPNGVFVTALQAIEAAPVTDSPSLVNEQTPIEAAPVTDCPSLVNEQTPAATSDGLSVTNHLKKEVGKEVDPVPPPDPVFSAGTAARNATTQNRTQPTPAETSAEQTPAAKMATLADLVAVGVSPAIAGALVAAFPADHIEAHAAAFRADLAAGQQIKAGALVHRIKKWATPAPVLATEEPDAEERKRARFAEIAGALAAPAAQEAPGDAEPAPAVPEHPAAPQTAAHRQRQPAAPAAHRQHSAPAAPARQPDPAPALADDAPAQLWRQVLRSLAGADPHMARLLENSTLHDTGADWSIHLADAAGADWLQSRAARRLSQEIALYDPDRQRRPVTIAAPLAPNHAQEATAYA